MNLFLFLCFFIQSTIYEGVFGWNESNKVFFTLKIEKNVIIIKEADKIERYKLYRNAKEIYYFDEKKMKIIVEIDENNLELVPAKQSSTLATRVLYLVKFEKK